MLPVVHRWSVVFESFCTVTGLRWDIVVPHFETKFATAVVGSYFFHFGDESAAQPSAPVCRHDKYVVNIDEGLELEGGKIHIGIDDSYGFSLIKDKEGDARGVVFHSLHKCYVLCSVMMWKIAHGVGHILVEQIAERLAVRCVAEVAQRESFFLLVY